MKKTEKNNMLFLDNDQLNAVLNASELAIWKYLPKNAQIIGSKNFNKLLEINSSEQLELSRLRKQIYPPDQKTFDAFFRQIDRGHFPEKIQLRKQALNAQLSWLQIEVTKLGKEVIGVCKDIQQQKAVDQKNMIFEKYVDAYNEIFSEHSIVAKTDAKGKIIYANKKFSELSQYSYEELLGKNHRILNSGHHPKSFFKQMWGELKQGKVWKGIIKNKKKDGSFYWVDTTIIPIKNEKGVIEEYFAFRYDITKEKEIGYSLESIIQSSPGIVYQMILDDDGKISFPFVSEKIKDILGLSPREVEKDSDKGLSRFLPESLENLLPQIEESAVTLNPFTHTGRIKDTSGAIRWVHSHNIPRKLRDGAIIWDGILIDVTEQKEQEKKLQKNQEELRKREKLAMMGEIVAMVGHEINNPLAISMGNISYLKKYLKEKNFYDKEIEGYLEKHENASQRIKAIVSELREISRDSSEKKIYQAKEVLSKCVEMVKELYQSLGISVICEKCNEELYINVNEGELQQIMLNLLSNARDATEFSDLKEIRIKLEELNEKVSISVHDSGTGIPKDVQPKIFENFFTTKETFKGTGLGLPLVKKMVEAHGGEINFHSEKGKGSTFYFSLPTYQKPQQASDTQDKTSNQLIDTNIDLDSIQGKKALIVDDEEGIRELLVLELEELGLEVTEATSGQQACQILLKDESLFDVVFSDIRMPGMLGTELVKKIKMDHKMEIPIFLVTGGVQQDWNYVNGIDISPHVEGIVRKPFNENDIADQLCQLFSQKKAA